LIVSFYILHAVLLKPKIFPQEGGDLFIFLFKDGAGAIDQAGAGGQIGGDMAEDLFLYGLVMEDFVGIEEKEFFGGAAPGAAAGAGGVGEDEVEVLGAGVGWQGLGAGVGWQGLGEVGDKGVVFFYPGLLEAAPEVLEDGFQDVGDGDVHLRVEVVSEDGFSAAGCAGVPKGGRGGAGDGGWEKGGHALGAIVLDDDFLVGGEIVFDFETVWEAEGEGGDEFIGGGGVFGRWSGEFLQDGLFVAGADAEKEVGLAEEGQAKGVVIDAGREFVRPGEDVGDAEAGAFGL